MKIALSMICKGTESPQQVFRVLNSVAKHVDAIYVTYTWEKGEAIKVFEKFGAKVSHFAWVKDFAVARNFALEQIPEDYEYVLWLDCDDELIGGENIRELIKTELDAYYMTYNYQIDEQTGEILQAHPRERIVKRDKFEWKGKLHETLIPKGQVQNVFTKKIIVNHHPDPKVFNEGLKRNIEILEQAYHDEVVEKKVDPRTQYYLARCYYDDKQFEKAAVLLESYVKVSGWDEERAMAYNYLAEIARQAKDFDKAVEYLLQSIKERPEFPTWYISLGSIYAQKEDWDRALFYVKQGLALDQPKTSMVLTPRDDKLRALETVFIACMAKNMLKEANSAAKQILHFFPEDKDILARVEYTEHLMKNVELGKSIVELVKRLDETNPDKIEGLLNMLPEDLQNTALIERLRQKYTNVRDYTDTIVYYCGKGFEKWSPESLKKGIGGSETAVIQLCKNWAKAGKKVVVFADPEEEGTYDGVEYKAYWRFNVRDTFGTLIVWRNETLLDAPLKAKRILFDAHDVLNPAEWSEKRYNKVEKIFVKSQYHREFLPKVPDEKFIIVPNGIDLSLLPKESKKKPFKLVYASSYDRGLEYGLRFGWPIIKRAIPEAELHIYYGWNLFDKFYGNNPERQAWKKEMVELMSQPGVFEHGRVSQEELIKIKAESSIHYYPCTFEEIDCISVRESAAVGCIPFTTEYGALKGRSYCETQEGDIFEKETHVKLAEGIAQTLKGDALENGFYKEFVEAARKESWTNIAKQWETYL